MKLSFTSLQCCLLLISSALSADVSPDISPPKDSISPCVARSTSTGLYYDLSVLSLLPPTLKDGKKTHKGDRDTSWSARGYDYPSNFTINICLPVIEDVKNVVGVEREQWGNISAYYEEGGKTYSTGQQASNPFFRGRKLVLNYTGGSPCPGGSRSKSTLISFLCDRDGLTSQPTISFVGTMDSCTYFFEVRTTAACGSIVTGPNVDGLGPAGIFGVIALVAVAVYLIGGCAYQRTVMHQRGWRQCPNYSLWAGMFGFVKDMIIILFSSLGRALQLNRSNCSGYSQADGGRNSRGLMSAIGGRRERDDRRDVDAENRLIDELDGEWEE